LLSSSYFLQFRYSAVGSVVENCKLRSPLLFSKQGTLILSDLIYAHGHETFFFLDLNSNL